MIGHVSIGVRDSARSKRFYDAALKPLGYTCLSESEGSLGYGRGTVALWISTVEKPVLPDAKSGLHFCFTAASDKSVDAFHAAALAGRGTSDGAPGLRPKYNLRYYAAFIRDPDGNRIEAVTFLREATDSP